MESSNMIIPVKSALEMVQIIDAMRETSLRIELSLSSSDERQRDQQNVDIIKSAKLTLRTIDKYETLAISGTFDIIDDGINVTHMQDHVLFTFDIDEVSLRLNECDEVIRMTLTTSNNQLTCLKIRNANNIAEVPSIDCIDIYVDSEVLRPQHETDGKELTSISATLLELPPLLELCVFSNAQHVAVVLTRRRFVMTGQSIFGTYKWSHRYDNDLEEEKDAPTGDEMSKFCVNISAKFNRYLLAIFHNVKKYEVTVLNGQKMELNCWLGTASISVTFFSTNGK
jgi:hypothetical protein